jgi:hypothetical protein
MAWKRSARGKVIFATTNPLQWNVRLAKNGAKAEAPEEVGDDAHHEHLGHHARHHHFLI